MNWAIFCRSNHPAGYGGLSSQQLTWDEEQECYTMGESIRDFNEHYLLTAAHGYVTVVVMCPTDEDMEVARSSVYGSWFQWQDRKDDWYGGRLDFVGALPGWWPVNGSLPVVVGHYQELKHMPIWHSLGDNRAFAVLSIENFLQQLFPVRWHRFRS